MQHHRKTEKTNRRKAGECRQLRSFISGSGDLKQQKQQLFSRIYRMFVLTLIEFSGFNDVKVCPLFTIVAGGVGAAVSCEPSSVSKLDEFDIIKFTFYYILTLVGNKMLIF